LNENPDEVPNASLLAVAETNEGLLRYVMQRDDNCVNDIFGSTKQSLLHLVVKQNKPQLVSILLDTPGIEVDTPDLNDWTPLHVAVQCGFVDIALELIKRGANPTSKNNKGLTPFLLGTLGLPLS